ncbi:MAG: cobyric acid synthase, partial [Blautia sp.]
EYDIIVIEGAGSPAEINLKQEDIVNMGMAKLAKAPVLLVGDIDRGGVFAQLVGTIMLLEEDEQRMVKGMIINKFRGDKTILDPGVKTLEEKTNIPVVGVAPYMELEVEDEDSLTERFSGNQEVGVLDIAVIRVPRISNFTDFNALEVIPGVSLRYVKNVNELKNPDMIILPGTKNTMEDLLWLRQNGLEAAVLKKAAEGKVIFGICGGYQMLGETLSDPEHVEAGGEIKGMGLLPMHTVFKESKTRTRVQGRFPKVEGILHTLMGVQLEGYEIHMGESTLSQGAESLTEITDMVKQESKMDGAYCKNVYGSYVHGIFDKEDVAKKVVEGLGEQKGIDVSNMAGVNFAEFKETQYDKLAEGLRKHLDMKKIYEILEQGI